MAGLPRHVVVEEGTLIRNQEHGNPVAGARPQFIQPMTVSGYINEIPHAAAGYDRPRPGEHVTRWSRVQRYFSLGIGRIESIRRWPNFPAVHLVDDLPHIQASTARVPKFTVGWGEPRRNIMVNPTLPVNALAAFYPHVYGAGGVVE